MLKRSATLLFAIVALTACNEDNSNTASNGKPQMSVIGSLRPKADPAMVEQIRQEELQRQQAAQEQAIASNQDQGSNNGFFGWSGLPKVETGSISGDYKRQNTQGLITSSTSGSIPGTTEANATSGSPSGTPGSPDQSASTQNNSNPFWPFGQSQPAASPPPQQVASYGGYGSSGGSAGLIPPPPAVTLSTQAQTMAPAPPPQYAMAPPGADYQYNPYAYNPYAIPPGAQPVAPQQPKFQQGSMFGNQEDAGSGQGASEDKPKKADIQVITPTGMEARSGFKQRDDLKILFKAALAVNGLAGPSCRDAKIAADVAKVDVGLPSESTKGSAAIGQRQIDMLFKGSATDKRIVPAVKKIQSEVASAYFRYLYSFNKYSLAQQTVAARKQEVSVAESNSEKQRAAADLAKAQEEADSTKDDLRSAQNDLAGISGAPAARSVIQRVSGTAPSLESLAQAEPQKEAPQASGTAKVMSSVGGFFGNMGGMIGLGGKKQQAADGDTAGGEEQQVAKAKPEKVKDDKNKDKKGKGVKAPQEAIAARPADAPKGKAEVVEEPVEKPAAAPSGSVAFQLKEVQTTPRKSVLRVAIRNNGDEQFKFDPDVVTVAEGDHKLAEAAVRAEFDTTVVQPNQEITGTITIFGRPWNDKLKVSLSDGGRTITMHR